MKNAGMNCSYEAKNFNNPTRQRPGDIFVPEFDNYGDAYFDISVINITCILPIILSRVIYCSVENQQ
jgi:hypothetical protein